MKKLKRMCLILAILIGGASTFTSCQNDEVDGENSTKNQLIANQEKMEAFEGALKDLQSKSNRKAMKGNERDRQEAIKFTLYKASKELIYSTGMSEKELNEKFQTETEVISFALKIQAKNANGNLKIK